MFENIVLTS